MKKDCAYIRKSLRKYLRGHLFKYEQVRIARHLNACPVCRSEFQALKKVADTKQLLKDITPPETLGQRVRVGVSGLSRLKLLLYRPLWVIAIIGAGALLYMNIIAPRHRDLEIENIEKSLPPAAPVASAPTLSAVLASAPVPTAQQPRVTEPARPAAATPPADPLLITITPAGENSVRRINEVMRGHGELRKMKFSDTVREISGSLTQKELLTFFARIEDAGRVSYSRKRFESFPSAEPVPFVIKMKPAPKPAEAAVLQVQEHKPAQETAASMPASAPTVSAP